MRVSSPIRKQSRKNPLNKVTPIMAKINQTNNKIEKTLNIAGKERNKE